jgi:hypothetical protein
MSHLGQYPLRTFLVKMLELKSPESINVFVELDPPGKETPKKVTETRFESMESTSKPKVVADRPADSILEGAARRIAGESKASTLFLACLTRRRNDIQRSTPASRSRSKLHTSCVGVPHLEKRGYMQRDDPRPRRQRRAC